MTVFTFSKNESVNISLSFNLALSLDDGDFIIVVKRNHMNIEISDPEVP